MQSLNWWYLPYFDDITVAFNDIIIFIMFNDVNLNDGICDVHYNQCISNVKILNFYLTLGKIAWVGWEFLSQDKTRIFFSGVQEKEQYTQL